MTGVVAAALSPTFRRSGDPRTRLNTSKRWWQAEKIMGSAIREADQARPVGHRVHTLGCRRSTGSRHASRGTRGLCSRRRRRT
jgi:hypothetical protein